MFDLPKKTVVCLITERERGERGDDDDDDEEERRGTRREREAEDLGDASGGERGLGSR